MSKISRMMLALLVLAAISVISAGRGSGGWPDQSDADTLMSCTIAPLTAQSPSFAD